MRPCGLQRRVRFLLCVAAVLLSGCGSQDKYNDLESKYTTLQRQYTELQGQHTQLQAGVGGPGGAKFRGPCRPEKGD